MNSRKHTDPVVSVDSLTFTYPGALEPCLKNVTLHVGKGEFLAVAGNNGSGKSTLCKVINALIPQFISGDMEGTAVVCGIDITQCDISELSKRVGYVYQDFENQIICPTVLDDASFACLNYAIPEHLERGREALRAVGLGDKENEYIWQLSGGEKHLLALAGIIALDPDIFILDEPAAQLDFGHARKVYDVLRNLNENYGKTIIVIEHHAEFIAEYCDDMVLMDCGRILWKRRAKEALRLTEELIKRNVFPPQITLAARRLQESGRLSDDCVLPTTLDEGMAVFPLLGPCHIRKVPDSTVKHSDPCVRFVDMEAEYSSIKGENHRVFDGITLDLFRGRKTALVGRNGSGKSTLLKLLAGLIRPSAGDILLDGQSILKMPIESLAQKVFLVFQNPEEMLITDSIRNDIEYALKSSGTRDYSKRADELLSLFDLEDFSHKDGRLLSGGQMRRASIAIGVTMNPPVLLLDEPTSNLDMASRKKILHSLERISDIVDTIVIATHDMQLVCEWADRIVVLSGGIPLVDGNCDAIFSNRELMEQAGICPPSIYHMGKALDPSASCFTIDEFVSLFGEDETDA